MSEEVKDETDRKKKRSILLIIVFILESRGRKLLNRQN